MREKTALRIRPAVAIVLLGCASFLGAITALVGAAHIPSLAALMVSGVRAETETVSFATGFSPIVAHNLPAVVNISTSKVVRGGDGARAPFSPFFGPGRETAPFSAVPRERREQALGSGVIVRADGYLITNNHVIEGASEIKVFLADKREFKATVAGADPKTDVAVLKIDGKDLPAMQLGDSNRVRVGDFVLAIGNPFGIGETVTMGIVSATGRSGFDTEDYEDFIQTDAAINPGNSGGALVNVRGELVGINTMILSSGDDGGNEGIGFAVPINMVRGIMEQILKNGKVVRGWVGLGIQDVTQPMARAFGMNEARGVLVTEIQADGPAKKSDLAVGDVILEMNGQPVRDMNQFRLSVASLPPGANVRFKLVRDGKSRETAITLGELPVKSQRVEVTRDRGPLAGLTIDELTAEIAQQLGLSSRVKGVVIADVSPNSPAADLGLQRGDVIVEVNRKPVGSVDDFGRALDAVGRRPILLRINRGGENAFLVVEPQ